MSETRLVQILDTSKLPKQDIGRIQTLDVKCVGKYIVSIKFNLFLTILTFSITLEISDGTSFNK